MGDTLMKTGITLFVNPHAIELRLYLERCCCKNGCAVVFKQCLLSKMRVTCNQVILHKHTSSNRQYVKLQVPNVNDIAVGLTSNLAFTLCAPKIFMCTGCIACITFLSSD